MDLKDSQKPFVVKGAEATHTLLGRRVKYRLSAKFYLLALAMKIKSIWYFIYGNS